MVLAYHLGSKEGASKISGRSAASVRSVKNAMGTPEGRAGSVGRLPFTLHFCMNKHQQVSDWLPLLSFF